MAFPLSKCPLGSRNPGSSASCYFPYELGAVQNAGAEWKCPENHRQCNRRLYRRSSSRSVHSRQEKSCNSAETESTTEATPTPQPPPPKSVHTCRLPTVPSICSHSSGVTKPRFSAGPWQSKGGPLSPASRAANWSHGTKFGLVESDNVPEPVSPPRPRMQRSNKKESASLRPRRTILAREWILPPAELC